MTIKKALIISFSLLYPSSVFANDLTPSCSALIYFDPQVGEPLESLTKLEKKVVEQSFLFEGKQNFLDYSVEQNALFSFPTDSKALGFIEILLKSDDAKVRQGVRRDIHHTELRSGAKFEITMLPEGYGGLHFLRLTCTVD